MVAKRLQNNKKINLEFDKSVYEYLGKKGFDPQFGARPLKRLIQSEILDELALRIIENKIPENAKIKISVDKNKITIK